MNEPLLPRLTAMRERVLQDKALLEHTRDNCARLEMIDPAVLLESSIPAAARPYNALYSLAKTNQVAAEHNIGVLEQAAATLNQAIALAEGDRASEAEALFQELGSLGKRFWKPASPRKPLSRSPTGRLRASRRARTGPGRCCSGTVARRETLMLCVTSASPLRQHSQTGDDPAVQDMRHKCTPHE